MVSPDPNYEGNTLLELKSMRPKEKQKVEAAMKKLMQEGEGDGELVDEIMFEYLIGALMKDKMLLDRIQKHNYPGDTRRMHPIESE